jgi:hypothetical protein
MRSAFFSTLALLLAGCTPAPYAPFANQAECIETLRQSAQGEWFTGPNLNGVRQSWAAPYEGGALICGYTGNGTRFVFGRENSAPIWRHSTTTGVEPLWSQYCARGRICEYGTLSDEGPSPLEQSPQSPTNAN